MTRDPNTVDREPLIEVRGAVKRFGAAGSDRAPALAGVELRIGAGESVGLLGPNGAGKTTLLSLVLGLRRPSEGRVRLFGGDPGDPRSRLRLGSTPQQSALPEVLRVSETLDFVAAHFPGRADTDRVVEEFGLAPLLRRQCGALSGGQQRRVAVALAFVGSPELVLLDEPTAGLDVEGRAALWQALRERNAAGCTLVVTSHHLEEIEALAERVVVLDRGRILADEPLERVLDRAGRRSIGVRGVAAERLAQLDGGFEPRGAEGELVHGVAADADGFVRALVASGLPFSDLTIRGASLEEAFLDITGAGGAARSRSEHIEGAAA
ncbi:MAG: ABC transporter ATP-binding protein [Pseudoclavibacter sp.]|nr:ABC transporter ATP-binding protein [Pseudoclavibacter sp.]